MTAVLLAFVLIAGDASAESKAPAAKCGGSNAVEELKSKHPELHRKVVEQGAKVQNANAVLWRIEAAESAPSYLFGTMHVSDPRMTALSEKTKSALASSKTIALEIADLSPHAMGKAVAGRPDLIIYMDGSRLDQKLSPEEFAIARDALAGSGLPQQMAPMVKPWFVYLLMSVPTCEIARVKSGKLVLDAVLAQHGKQHNLRVIGLETPIQQMEIIAGLDEKDQIEMLRTSLAFADKREDMLETLIQLYHQRRIGQVVPLSNALAEMRGFELHGMGRFMKTVIVERNYGMRDKAVPLIESGGAFIAVGALHLVGEKGLVALFREKGYRLTAIE